jgi:SHAQKYF class myb-like DNA-binding protein
MFGDLLVVYVYLVFLTLVVVVVVFVVVLFAVLLPFFLLCPGKSGENTGRWTSEEHDFFLEGLRNYGKEWKKIAELIQTRTVVQIRTHAQKYFQKVAKARLCGGEDVPCTFKSTAMSTCPKKNGGNIIVGTLAGSNGTTAHIAYSTSSSSSSNANGGGGNPNQRKRKNNASLSNSKRTKRKPRSRTISCLADFGGINYHQINNDQLIKLDLFSATTQPAKMKKMKTGTSKYYQKKHAEQMRKEQEQMDGGTSPTTAMTDLFAGLDGSMGGLDFLNDDFTEYDFSSDQEESESDVPDSGASTPRSGTSTPPQAAADRITSASTTDDETTRNTTNKKKKNIHQHTKNNTNKKKKKKQKYGAAKAQPVQRSNPYARTFRSLHKKDTKQRMNNRLGL